MLGVVPRAISLACVHDDSAGVVVRTPREATPLRGSWARSCRSVDTRCYLAEPVKGAA